ncbi:MAG: hypothetical protein QXW00_03170 [Candidatus Woesearchaeota archaeon]
MERKARILMLALTLMLLTTIGAFPTRAQNLSNQEGKIVLYLFWGDGCPHCAEEKPFLMQLQQKYPQLEIRMFEVWHNESNRELFYEMASQHGIRAEGVPTTFLGNKSWVGYSQQIGSEIERQLQLMIYQQAPRQLCIHLFINNDCSQCSSVLPFLESVRKKYGIDLKIHDVSNSSEAQLYEQLKDMYSLPEAGFPIVFMGNSYYVGTNSITKNLEGAVQYCLSHECTCPIDKISGITPYLPRPGEMSPETKTLISLPGIGELDASKMSLPFFTIIIAGLDSFNPCAFFVLFFLLSMLIYAKNRKRMLLIGLTFVFFSGLIYFLFMAAWLNIFLLIGNLNLITTTAGIIAVIVALINIKDFFLFKKGISLSIPEKAKPKLFERMRSLLKASSLSSMLISTIVLALAANSYELLCTAGFPMVFTRILTLHNISRSGYYAYLLLYNLIYVLPLLVIVLFFTLTLGARKLTEWEGRVLKLTSGLMMLLLGIVLLVKPALLNNALVAFLLLGVALLIDLLIILATKLLDRKEVEMESKIEEHEEIPAENKENKITSEKRKR